MLYVIYYILYICYITILYIYIYDSPIIYTYIYPFGPWLQPSLFDYQRPIYPGTPINQLPMLKSTWMKRQRWHATPMRLQTHCFHSLPWNSKHMEQLLFLGGKYQQGEEFPLTIISNPEFQKLTFSMSKLIKVLIEI